MTLRLFPELTPTEIVAGQCPSDPIAVLRVLQAVLPWALIYRRRTYHVARCQDSRVNETLSRPVAEGRLAVGRAG